MKGDRPARPIPRQPFVDGALRDPGRRRSLGHRPTLLSDTVNQKGSTMDRHARILVNVHPGLQEQTVWLRNHSLTPKPRVNNLHSNDS